MMALIYLLFVLVRYFVFQRKRLDFVSFAVSVGTLILALILICFAGCIVDLVAFITVLIALSLGICLFLFGAKQEDKIKKAYYEKHPVKQLVAIVKHRATQNRAETKFLEKLNKQSTNSTIDTENNASPTLDNKPIAADNVNTAQSSITTEQNTTMEGVLGSQYGKASAQGQQSQSSEILEEKIIKSVFWFDGDLHNG